MDRIATLLTLRPILYGLIGMLISGVSFPVVGVIVVQNGLIPMRYMLMHGVILGGIAAVATGLPMLATTIPLNIALVLVMLRLNRNGRTLSTASTAMMVCTMGLASLFSHIFDVPAMGQPVCTHHNGPHPAWNPWDDRNRIRCNIL